jgi:hypothetical protein
MLGPDIPARLSAGFSSSPDDKRLWNELLWNELLRNELLRAPRTTADAARPRRLAADLRARGGGARGLPARTEALLDELLPTWRGGGAAAG